MIYYYIIMNIFRKATASKDGGSSPWKFIF